MAHKKRSTIGKYLLRAVMTVPMLFGVIGNIFSLLEIEARNTGRSIFYILMLCIFTVSVLTTTWVCLLAMLFLWLVSLQLSWQLSLFVLVVVNLVLLLLMIWMITALKKNLFFPETRGLVKSILRSD